MSSGKMLDIPKRYREIAPATKKRRWVIPLSILSDLLPVAGGILIAVYFPLLYRWWVHFIGLLITFVGIYRIIYHIVMGVGLYKAIYKKRVTSVWSLISELALKTPTDVLALIYRHVKHGYFIGLGVKNLEVYRHDEKKKK